MERRRKCGAEDNALIGALTLDQKLNALAERETARAEVARLKEQVAGLERINKGALDETLHMRGSAQTAQREAAELRALLNISHADTCCLSLYFNRAASLGIDQHRRVNEWLKQLIARAALSAKDKQP